MRLNYLLSCLLVFHFAISLAQVDPAGNGSKKNAIDTALVGKLILKSNRFSENNEFDSGISCLTIALSAAKTSNNIELIARVYEELGRAFYQLGNIPKSKESIENAISLQLKQNNTVKLAKLYANLGGCFFSTGDLNQALKFYSLSFDNAVKCNDSNYISSSYYNIGLVYAQQEEFEKAITNLNGYLNYITKKNDGSSRTLKKISDVYSNLGIIYGEDTMAKKSFTKQLEFAMRAKSMENIASANLNLGNLYRTKHENKVSRTYLETALNYSRLSKNDYYIGYTLLSLGELDFAEGNYQIARRNILLSTQYSLRSESREYLTYGYKCLSSVDSAIGDFKSALVNYKIYSKLHDSLLTLDNDSKLSQKLSDLQTKIENENFRRVLDISNRLEKEKTSRQKVKDILYITIILLLTFYVIYFIYSNNIKKRLINIIGKVNRHIDEKNIELERRLEEINEMKGLLEHDLEHFRELASRKLINPHFLFNSLNSIQAFYLKNDSLNANIYLTNFSKLIRKNLHFSQFEFIALENEIELLELYLRLEEQRFTKRFDYDIQFDKNIIFNLDKFLIPPLLLQPIIENAIIHGVMSKDSFGNIRIKFETLKETIKCTIEDNGIGIARSLAYKKNNDHISMGTKITAERIKVLTHITKKEFKIEHLEISDNNLEVTGTRVIVTFPIMTSFKTNNNDSTHN